MYKGASQNLQRRQGVAFIRADSEPSDALPDVAQMSVDQAEAELAQLKVEIARVEQEIAAAKAAGRGRLARSAGQRKASLCQRASVVKHHLRAIGKADREAQLQQAIREVCSEAQAEAIFARARELQGAAR